MAQEERRPFMAEKSVTKRAQNKPSRDHLLDHQVERLIFFSDAVFAIAITLLVIEIHVPHLDNAPPMAALAMLENMLPSFFGFVLSFLVIGRFWIGHHSALGRVQHFSSKLLWPNLMLLMSIAFMPFATAFMAQNIGQLVPTAFYNATLLVTALLSWRAANVAYDLWPDGNADMAEFRALRLRGLGVALGAATALAVTFLTPLWSQLALLTMPIWQALIRKVSTRIVTWKSTEGCKD